jgi:hypothetical protein
MPKPKFRDMGKLKKQEGKESCRKVCGTNPTSTKSHHIPENKRGKTSKSVRG